MLLKLTDTTLQKDMKCHACDTEEMETQKRGLKHLIYTIPLTYGIKTVDSCIAALHWLDVYCEEQSNWEQNSVRQLLPALSPYLSSCNYKKTCCIASCGTHSVEILFSCVCL